VPSAPWNTRGGPFLYISGIQETDLYQGGFIPDLVLWLSYFYTSRELPIRLSFFWTALSVTTIVTSLLAFAIFHLEGRHGLAGWRLVGLPLHIKYLLTDI
jgi:hypothetical protein